MKKLTNVQGIPRKCLECKDSEVCDYWCVAYDECVKKLREYEELELTPEQIREMDRIYSEQAKELGEYKKAEKKLNGISLKELADAYIKIIEKETDEKYSRGRLLTNEDADKWDEYKNLEQQGKLPKLLCNVGDTVYTNYSMQGWYFRKENRPYSAKIVFIGFNGVDNYMNIDFENGHMLQFKFSDIGKTVFLTQEEAKVALKRMEDKHE